MRELLSPISLYVLLFVGFLLVAWIVNTILDFFRKEDFGTADRVATFLLLGTLFGTYTYFMSLWLRV